MAEWVTRERVLRLRRSANLRMSVAEWLRRGAEALHRKADEIEAGLRAAQMAEDVQ